MRVSSITLALLASGLLSISLSCSKEEPAGIVCEAGSGTVYGSVRGIGCKCVKSDSRANSDACAPSVLAGKTSCVANDEYPNRGVCECLAARCVEQDKGTCKCSFSNPDVGGPADAACYPSGTTDANAPANGKTCCLSSYSDACTCGESAAACRSVQGTEVDSCTTERLRREARSGDHWVPFCRDASGDVPAPGSSSSSSSSGSGGTCPGSGYVSCTTSADCSCGLTCSRLTSSSTDRFCTQTCTEDADCSGSKSWAFSSIGCNPATKVCIP